MMYTALAVLLLHCLFNLFPGATLAESIPGTQRPGGAELWAGSSVTLRSWHLGSSLTKRPAPLLPSLWPKTLRLPLRSRAEDPSVKNDLFEGRSGSFQRRFSSRSLSQRCISVWSSRPKMPNWQRTLLGRCLSLSWL